MGKKEIISSGKAILGIEFGSTRIKSVLISPDGEPLAQGSHTWENQLVDGLWTYSEDAIWNGLQDSYTSLTKDVDAKYGCKIKHLSSIGISAMMHGYLPFDAEGKLLVPFRTWRNTNTGDAAKKLSELFNFNIPLRWSISHVYQAILNHEPHVADIKYLTTLAGYIHWKLTGRKVLGVGDASGMMPIDSSTKNYDRKMQAQFDELIAPDNLPWKIEDILPEVLEAGEEAGTLTDTGAQLLDVSGTLEAGIPLCPPEGDAGTGMVATNAVRPRTGNVSAGTSSFSMIVLEKSLSRPYSVIDMVTTPDGNPVAMVHCNNCTSEINSWMGLFKEVADAIGTKVDMGQLFTAMFNKSLEGDADCGGLVTYNYVSGEPVMGLTDGRPLFAHSAESKFSLANFLRSQLYAAIAVLKEGNDVLFRHENVIVDRLMAHGGYFTTKGVGQRYLAAALGVPVSVMETAGEGGAWGIALLAAYMTEKKEEESLPDFLQNKIFAGNNGEEVKPTQEDIDGFNAYFKLYKACLPIEQKAVEVLK